MARVALDELPVLARELRERLEALPPKNSATLVFLHGELGAGKTTFTQALAREFGVAQNIQSPTYVLMKSYPLNRGRFKRFVHLDCYRLKDGAEFAALLPAPKGERPFLEDPDALVVVEWPERGKESLPAPDVAVDFAHDGNDATERSIVVQ